MKLNELSENQSSTLELLLRRYNHYLEETFTHQQAAIKEAMTQYPNTRLGTLTELYAQEFKMVTASPVPTKCWVEFHKLREAARRETETGHSPPPLHFVIWKPYSQITEFYEVWENVKKTVLAFCREENRL